MAITLVKNVGSATLSMATSGSVTVPAAGVALGDLLVVRGTFDSGAGTVSVADTQGNTYTSRLTLGAGTTYAETYVFTCVVGTALVSGNTITLSTTKTTGAFVVDQFTGQGTYEEGAGTSATSSTPSSGSVTQATAGLVYGILGNKSNRVVTEDTDNTGGDTWHSLTVASLNDPETNGAYKVTTSAVSLAYDPTLDTSDVWSCGILLVPNADTGHTATGALTLPSVTVSGTGAEVFTSTGALTVPGISIAGSGHHPHQATGALSLPGISVSGVGAEVFTSTGAVTTQPIVIAGDGTHTNEKIGTGALTLPAVTLDGTGEETFTATGAVALSAVTISGAGAEVFTATGTVTTEPVVIAGTATHFESPTGTGALTLTAPTLDGTGAVVLTGTGAISLAGISIAGVGDSGTEPEPEPLPTVGGRRRKPTPKRHIEGYGALVVAPSLVAGRGVTFDDDIRWLLPPELVLAGAI